MPPATTEELIVDVLLSMVVADDDVDPDELQTLCRVVKELTGQEIAAKDLLARATARLDAPHPTAFPPGLAQQIDTDLRPKVLAAAVAIAEADGFVLDEEDELLSRLAIALGLPPDAHRQPGA